MEYELFNIGSFVVTPKVLLIAGGGIAGIVIAIIIVCLICSCWKRKKIAEAGRRLSTVTVEVAQ